MYVIVLLQNPISKLNKRQGKLISEADLQGNVCCLLGRAMQDSNKKEDFIRINVTS